MKASRKTLMALMVLGMSVAALETSAMARGADRADEHHDYFNKEEKVVHSGGGASNTIVIVSGRDDNRSHMVQRNLMDAPGSAPAARTVIGSEGSNANVNVKNASDSIDNGARR